MFNDFCLSVSFCGAAYSGFEVSTTLEQLRRLQESWVIERNWTQYHTPRNLVLALVGEVGELAEIFQWRGEVACSLPGWTERRKSKSQHLSKTLFLSWHSRT
jgi:dCTP diphosphatase